MSPAPRSLDEDGPWPMGTIGLCAAILVVFATLQVAGVLEHPASAALRVGAIDNASVFSAGEYWRLLPAAFVHFPLGAPLANAAPGNVRWSELLLALPHVLLNGWALIQLGTFMESVYGTARLLFVFLLSAIGCSLASAWFSVGVSAGASGGIFGLIGFLLVARWLHAPAVRTLVADTFGRQLLFWAAAVIALGASNPFPALLPIDQYGHLGGLATGLLLGAVLRRTDSEDPLVRNGALALVLATVTSFIAVANEGERASRVETGFEDAARAAQELDPATAIPALDLILGRDPASVARAVGKSPQRALVLVEAEIAAVHSAEALRFAEETAPLVGAAAADVLRATAHFAHGDSSQAREELGRVKAHASPTDQVALALFYEKAGWSGPALELLQSALASQPRDAEFLNAVAWVLLTAKDERFREPKRGLELARQSVEILPDQAASLDTLAEGELQARLLVDAFTHERRAVELARERRDEHLVKELSSRLAKIEALQPRAR